MENNKKLLCGEHGETNPCMVCCHLTDKNNVGYIAATVPDDDPEWAHLREAWCEKCDRWWNMHFVLVWLYNLLTPSPRMVCEYCLEEICEANAKPGRELGWWEKESVE